MTPAFFTESSCLSFLRYSDMVGRGAPDLFTQMVIYISTNLPSKEVMLTAIREKGLWLLQLLSAGKGQRWRYQSGFLLLRSVQRSSEEGLHSPGAGPSEIDGLQMERDKLYKKFEISEPKHEQYNKNAKRSKKRKVHGHVQTVLMMTKWTVVSQDLSLPVLLCYQWD